MNDIIQQIDDLMTSINRDTSKSELPTLCEKLIKLSKYYGEQKQELIRAKNKYDREFVLKKEQWRQYLEEKEEKKATADEKYKKSRITNADIESSTELELLTLKGEQEEAQVAVAFLDVYIKSIYERIQAVKFTSRQNQDFVKVRENNEDLPF